MLLPLLLISLGTLSAAMVAYGTHAGWGDYAHGLKLILIARQFQWPLVVFSLGASIALLLLVISGKRRAWWLIGLAPILALFVHRFATSPVNAMAVLENPQFVSAAEATFLSPEDYIVGVRFGEEEYAFPFAALYGAPVITQQDRDQRFILIWTATANRAMAFHIDRQIKPRELEIVSTPANALLIYNSRFGEFVNGITGRTTQGETPVGFEGHLRTAKMPWGQWRTRYPDSRVLAVRTSDRAPHGPVLPKFLATSRAPDATPQDAKVVLVGIETPVVYKSEEVKKLPLNLTVDGIPIVVFRDEKTGVVRAFDRRLEDDLTLQFKENTDKQRPLALVVDEDSGCGWNAEGVAVDGNRDFRGRRLKPFPVEDGLYWGVLKRWYPSLELQSPAK